MSHKHIKWAMNFLQITYVFTLKKNIINIL